MLAGVYQARKKDGTMYYRASITIKNKHISLGSFPDEKTAHRAYVQAGELMKNPDLAVDDYPPDCVIDFKKWVILVNFRDNGIYIKTPIYLKERYFNYYFSPEDYLLFDSDDLFYYSTHSIMRRGGHLFVADFGMQVNVLSRYGIRSFAAVGRDYFFINGNRSDFRSANLRIVNRYHGVRRVEQGASVIYETRIHVRGDLLVGRYESEEEAAVAYNKAAQTLIRNGIEKDFPANYLEEMSEEAYRELYRRVRISKNVKNYTVHS